MAFKFFNRPDDKDDDEVPELINVKRDDFNIYKRELFVRVDGIKNSLDKLVDLKKGDQRRALEADLEKTPIAPVSNEIASPERTNPRDDDNEVNWLARIAPIFVGGLTTFIPDLIRSVSNSLGINTNQLESDDSPEGPIEGITDDALEDATKNLELSSKILADKDGADLTAIEDGLSDERLNEKVEEVHNSIFGSLRNLFRTEERPERERVEPTVARVTPTAAPTETPETPARAEPRARPERVRRQRRQSGTPVREQLGSLSERYESGSRGSSAIGVDRTGGTSYGRYQIATRTGTMDRFLEFLRTRDPDAYQRLRGAGNPDTGQNGNFAREWRALAQEGNLGGLEHEFIRESHFDAALSRLSNNIRSKINRSSALQQVLWSTAVQHGPERAADIFTQAYHTGLSDEDYIRSIYTERSTRFGSSTNAVRESVMDRFESEQERAIAMIQTGRDISSRSNLATQSRASTNVQVVNAGQSTTVNNARTRDDTPPPSLMARNPDSTLITFDAQAVRATGTPAG